MWVLCKESGYKLITLQKEAGGEERRGSWKQEDWEWESQNIVQVKSSCLECADTTEMW